MDKLLSKLEEESEPDPPTSQEDECVICINARATMQTSPCGHRVVCRRCFVKTIQSAVAQRLLPLRCVICRARVNRLTSSSGSWRIQESASSYSMGAKSWASAGVHAGGVVASASSYSMNDAHSEHHAFHQPTLHKAAGGRHHYAAPRGAHGRVSQSDSLYSMSSTGSAGSTLSGYSHYSKTSSISSSGPCSPASPAAITASSAASANHLAPPSPNTHHHHQHQHHNHNHNQHQVISPSGSSSCSSASIGSLSPRDNGVHHSHHGGCPSGCSGAVPRKPLHMLSNSASTSSSSSSSGCGSGSGSGSGSGAMTPMMPTHTYPGRRHVKSRLLDLQNRLPPIKEFRSPAKVPHPSPVHVSNPRFRYASYTKSSGHELAPLLRESTSPPPPRRPSPMNIQLSCTALAPPPLKAGGAKICPVTSKNSLPKNAYVMPKEKKLPNGAGAAINGKGQGGRSASLGGSSSSASKAAACGSSSSVVGGVPGNNCKPHSSASNRSFPLFSTSSGSSNSSKEKADNKKNESMERKKKEEKLKMKAEKEARKEEKRLAKEEERLAKLHAKEEKKRGKKEAKELLLANDGNNKK
ncbi:hypothetical protein ACLKA7_012745 [Drosophila subpalustris]